MQQTNKQMHIIATIQMKAGAPVLGGVGAMMMAKMGWKEGEGLGKDG